MGLPPQVVSFVLHRDDFQTLVAPARTFTFAAWVESHLSQGLIRGGSFENALVLDDKGKPVNPPMRYASSLSLPWVVLLLISPFNHRFRDEPARHKLLDCIGDLALAGAPL